MPITLTAWGPTGFNAANLPKDPTSLDALTPIATDLPVDLCQIYGLSSVRVPLTEEDAYKVDYLMITDGSRKSYYATTGLPVMTSYDVADIPIIQDPFMTIGDFTVIAGQISRAGYGAFSHQGRNNLIDQLMVPRYPLRKKYLSIGDFADMQDDDYINVVAASVDLSNNKAASSQFKVEEIYKVDPNTGTVTLNYVPTMVGSWTDVELVIPSSLTGGREIKMSTRTNGYGLFLLGNGTVQANLRALWAMGQIDGVIGAYKLPSTGLAITSDSAGRITKIVSTAVQETFQNRFTPSTLYADYNGPDKDFLIKVANIVIFSESYRIGILSTISGSQLITKAYNTTNSVYTIIDPRYGGRPYFLLPDQIKEESVEPGPYTMAMMFTRAISGGQWEAIPITYKGAVGWASAAAGVAMKNDMANIQTTTSNNAGNFGRVGSIASGAVGAIEGGVNWEIRDYDASRRAIARGGVGKYIDSTTPSFGGGLILGGIGQIVETGSDWLSDAGVSDKALSGISSNARNRYLREQEQNRDISKFLIDYKYVSPTVTGIPQTSWQGLVGNGVLLYCEYPDPEDVKNWGRIVQSFGLVSDQAITPDRPFVQAKSPPDADSKFTYIQIRGAVIKAVNGRGNARLVEDAEDALAVGIRFWKEAPSK